MSEPLDTPDTETPPDTESVDLVIHDVTQDSEGGFDA